MLSSIHPLGERGRGNRWALTAAAFVVGSVVAGSGAGAVLGVAGGYLRLGLRTSLWIVGIVAALAVTLDSVRVTPPGPKRQVNERWIGAYRGWVYGASFGVQLGCGVATYIVTWLVYAAAVAALASGNPTAGALIGVTFGVVRAAPLVAARWIDRPSRLGAFHRKMATLGPQVRMLSIVIGAAASVAAIGSVV